MSTHLVSAIHSIQARTGERWPFGPACQPSERCAYTTGWRTYRSWLREVEVATPAPTPAQVAERLLMTGRDEDPPPGYWRPEDLILHPTPWVLAPLTIGDASRRAVDGLYRTGQVHIGQNADGSARLVDTHRLWVLLDLHVNQPVVPDATRELGWPGLLAEAWMGYELRRRAAAAAAAATGQPWVEDPADLGRAAQWLAESVGERCGADRVFAAIDGAVLARAWDGGTPLTELLGAYYDPTRFGPVGPEELHVSNRTRLLYDASPVELPRVVDPTGAHALSITIRPHVAASAAALLARTLVAGGALPWLAAAEAHQTLSAGWGEAMLTQLTDDFATLVVAGTFGDGWDRGDWPVSRQALATYGGWQLRFGDSDADRRFGGVVRAAPPAGAPANPVAVLQGHLRDLGFAVADPVGRFDASTQRALREFQHAAFHREVSVRSLGPAVATNRAPAYRRFLGLPHGYLDEETARCLDVWCRPARYGFAGADRIVRPTLAGLPADEVERRAAGELYPWSTLRQARQDLGLTRAAFRRIGDAQKAQWRRRLLARAGLAGRDDTDPPIVLDTDEPNLFQLEAIAEFYRNYTDPWLPRAAGERVGYNVPRSPGDAGYERADFLDPVGTSFTVVGEPLPDPMNRTLVQVEGDLDVGEIWPADADTPDRTHRDLIHLPASTNPARQWFRVTNVAGMTRVVAIEGRHNLSGPNRAWRVHRRPRIVMVDPAGERPGLAGTGARSGPTPDKIVLDGTAPLTHININFDTIYLASDVARPSRAYRIIGCDLATRTVTLDGAPALDGEISPWQLPAGLGGRFTPETVHFRPRQSGVNHYEGALFIVYGDEVRGPLSFSSFSASSEAGDQRTAIRGNARYDCVSYTSGDDWKNYSIQIRTPGMGDRCAPARYYFDGMSNPRPLPGVQPTWQPHPPTPTVGRDPDKQHIRFHDGHTGAPNDLVDGHLAGSSGSAGCIVSPQILLLRHALVAIHQEERGRLNTPPNPDPALAIIAGWTATRDDAKDLYNRSCPPAGPPTPAAPQVRSHEWEDKIAMKLWLVRPDERPAGPGAP